MFLRRWFRPATSRAVAALTVAPLAFGCSATVADPALESAAASADLAFVDVRIVPMDRQTVLEGHTVLVEDGRISWVGPSGGVSLPESAERIDGQGRYLMPGLVDSHVHAWSEDHLKLYVANGITAVRNLWGAQVHLDWRRRTADDPEFVAPTIYTAGALIDGEPPIWPGSPVATTPDEGRALVFEHATAGYDFIKVYNRLLADTYYAIVEAAREQGVSVQGHVPNAVGLFRVLDSGQRAIEHTSGYMRATFAEEFSSAGQFQNAALAGIAERLRSGELEIDDVFEPASVQRAVEATVAAGTWNIPTVTVFQMVAPDEYEERASAHGTQYVNRTMIEGWNPATNPRNEGFTSDRLRDVRRLYHTFGHRMIAELHAAGAGLLVGTDTPNPFVLPGFSIHEELAHFVAAGLTPYETLERATRIPAEFMGEGDVAGTIAPGRRADLLLLDADPLADVGNVRRLAGISLRGRWLSREALEAMLEDIERRVAAGG